jgi:lysophospholipase L1-like esterase
MRGRWIFTAAVLLGLLGTAFTGAAPAAAAESPGPPAYYLALGDSLAAGVQPLAHGMDIETHHGYVDDLYATLKAKQPNLLLADLGCPGEDTQSMLTGTLLNGEQSPCYSPGLTQLDAAVTFLRTHRVSLVTLDIGANNVDGCITAAGINGTCLLDGEEALLENLPPILGELQAAAGRPIIVGMNYYDPFLAAWLQGPAGEALATESEEFTTVGLDGLPGFNALLNTVYSDFNVSVADVQDAFATTNFSPYDATTIPTNVALICAWTWMCAPAPYGPNIHANATGYAVIAGAFMSVMEARLIAG